MSRADLEQKLKRLQDNLKEENTDYNEASRLGVYESMHLHSLRSNRISKEITKLEKRMQYGRFGWRRLFHKSIPQV